MFIAQWFNPSAPPEVRASSFRCMALRSRVLCAYKTSRALLPGLILAALAARATPAVLNPNARSLFLASMVWGDRAWDERANFLWSLGPDEDGSIKRHLVRETSWYALGLLERNQPGDRARAFRALDAVLAQQFHEPGEPWDGTFYRAPEEPHPTPTAQMWNDYDPNWREFIGATFSMILLDYRDQLPAELRQRLESSIVNALEGESKEKRLKPSYTNIALMYGFLWNYAARELNRPEWAVPSQDWMKEVYRGFKEHDAFNEFNSPTYYGVDLYGLALLRVYGATPAIRKMASDMEAALWRSIANFYQADLKNIAGPYDRAYGMDMRRYVSVTGLWLRTVLPSELAPFPELKQPLDHANDLMFAPLAVNLGTVIPADAMIHFKKFEGERMVKQAITGNRVATAWIGKRIMLGGEFTGMSKEAGTPRGQFHPATIHWAIAGSDVGWVRLIECPRVDASAEPNTLRIAAIGNSTFRIAAPGLDAARIARQQWMLPDLIVLVDTDAEGFKVSEGIGYVDVKYTDATQFVLKTSAAGDEVTK